MPAAAGTARPAGATPEAWMAGSSWPSASMEHHAATFGIHERASVTLPERGAIRHRSEARREHRATTVLPVHLVFQVEDQQLFLVRQRWGRRLVIADELQVVGPVRVPEDDAIEALVVAPRRQHFHAQA